MIGVDMADCYEADEALFENLRDRQVLREMVAEVAGETIAAANKDEKAKTLKGIIRAHLEGSEGRTKVARWVATLDGLPPSAYTERGGVESVLSHAKVTAARDAIAAESEAAEVVGGAKAVDGVVVISDGVPEEGRLAVAAGAFLLPIGATGGAAKQLADQLIGSELERDGAGAQRPTDDELRALSDPTFSVGDLVDLVSAILKRVGRAA